MYPHRIQPITVETSVRAFGARLLCGARFLQIPEGRAFLLHQLRRRALPLAGLSAKDPAHAARLLFADGLNPIAVRSAIQRLAYAQACYACPDLPEEEEIPELDLEWPNERVVEEVPVLVHDAYPPALVVTLGNLFETLV